MITPTAPAFVAFLALTAKPQVPRSTSAMFPATAAALVKAVQPSVVASPAASAGSTAATTEAVTFELAMDGPKDAPPNWYAPAIAAGESTRTSGLPKESTLGKSAVTAAPSQTTR